MKILLISQSTLWLTFTQVLEDPRVPHLPQAFYLADFASQFFPSGFQG